jgi:putative nucleotidyltransferase with HDIG domain
MIAMNDILQQIEYLPVFNKTAQRAMQLLLDNATHNKDISDVIKYDSGLTANILKIANSAYFAHAVEIKDLVGAINYLGRDKMFQILTLSSTSGYFKGYSKGYEMTQGELWRHSISTGVIAEHLGFLEPTVNRGTLFTAGILHDVGKTILCTWVNDLWNDILWLMDKHNFDFIEAEKKVLGFTHALVGRAILQRWLFPDDVIQAAGSHHDDKIHANPVVRITKMADFLSITLGYMTSDDGMQCKGYEDLIDYYKIKSRDLEEILNECFEIIRSVLDDFNKID